MNKHTGSTYLEGTYPSLLSAMASKTYHLQWAEALECVFVIDSNLSVGDQVHE